MSVQEHPGVSAHAAISMVVARLVVKPVIALYPVRSWSFGAIGLLNTIAGRAARIPSDVEIERMELAGVPVEKLVPTVGEHRTDAAICYYHGGAFLTGGLATHRGIASALARTLGVTVYNVAYRQLPEVGIGTSVDDGYRVYRAVSDSGRYSQVAVGGDSAGGYISAKIVELAYLDAATSPAVYFGFSPLLTPTTSADDPRHGINDAYISATKLGSLRTWLDIGPVAPRGVDDAVAIDPEAFPPAVVVACTDEMLRVDAERLHERLDAAGQVCDLHLFEGGVHAFPVFVSASLEAKRAVVLTAEFVRAAFAAHREQHAA